MKTIDTAARKDRILMSIYASSIRLSLIALSVAAALEIFMFAYTFVNSEMYGSYLWRYRGFYLSLLTVALVAIALSCCVRKDIPHRFKALNYSSPIYAAFLFAWALAVTYSDYSVTGIVDPTVFMTFSLIVPLSAFLFPSVYAIIVIAANAILLYLTASFGCVSASELPGEGIAALARAADAKMYDSKALYYQLNGHDRRKYMQK